MPLRDAFAVLFFVSVGMLFNPAVLLDQPFAVLATVLIIVLGKSAAAYFIVRGFGHPPAVAFTVSASLAQIGEFSFILVGLGVTLGMMPPEGRDLVLAGAIISILLNPFLFALIERRRAKAVSAAPKPAPAAEVKTAPVIAPLVEAQAANLTPAALPDETPGIDEAEAVPTTMTGHEIIIGYGRVGSILGARLAAAGRPMLVFDERDEALAAARQDGAEVITGNAADPAILALSNLAAARRLFVTIPEAFEAGQVVQQARSQNPGLEILARAHSEECFQHLQSLGATLTILGEREIAHRMIERVFPPSSPDLP